MSAQPAAQLYRADFRGCQESEIFRRLSTFNFDGYFDPARAPFGRLEAFNDETLGAGRTLLRNLERESLVLILPLVGSVIFKDHAGHETEIGTEEIGIFYGSKADAYQLENPYEKDLINFLQIWIYPTQDVTPAFHKAAFSLQHRNQLDTVVNLAGIQGAMGLFDGRQSGTYTLQNPEKGLFAFVLAGAFEFDEKLLEARDAVAITGVQTVDFESLSENALLLLMEVPQQTRDLPEFTA